MMLKLSSIESLFLPEELKNTEELKTKYLIWGGGAYYRVN